MQRTNADRGGGLEPLAAANPGLRNHALTHARARACFMCTRAPRVRERVSWVMSALWYRCINLTKRRINLITSQRMSRRMMYRRRDERDVFREGEGKGRGGGDIWTHDVFFVPPTYGGCLILCKHAFHPMEKREEKRCSYDEISRPPPLQRDFWHYSIHVLWFSSIIQNIALVKYVLLFWYE